MAKRKLQRFAEMSSFTNVFHLPYEGFLHNNFSLKGKWHAAYFGNANPIVLELGCGKGEYTTGLAQQFPEKNFIGVDIKGARIWKGAKTAQDNGMANVAFLRARIDFIEAAFAANEVSEIWITFPDPQPQKARERKRLTSPLFLSRYKNILQTGGIVHLKTDNAPLYEYTLAVVKEKAYPLLISANDLYQYLHNEEQDWKALASIRTFYEEKFINQGYKICYLRFALI